MSESSAKYTETVKKLTRRTNEGELNWESYDPSDEVSESSKEAKGGYKTRYKGKEVRIYREITQIDLTNIEQMITQPELRVGKTGKETEVDTVMKLRDPETGGEWTFPKISILDDLHSAVQQSSAGVQQWMSDVLKDE
jgi:hypothetical protein